MSSFFTSKQHIDVERFVSSFDSFYVPIITYIEVYGFDFKDENQKILIDELFKSIEIVEVNKIIFEIAISIRKNKIRKIKIARRNNISNSKIFRNIFINRRLE